MTNGFMFYKQDIDYVKASNEVFLEKAFLESCLSNLMHGFISMESTAEAYNETFRNSNSSRLFQEFLNKNKDIGNHFNAKMKELDPNEDLDIAANENFNQAGVEATGSSVQNSMHELHRKSIANAYYNHWVKMELNELSMNYMFGPRTREDGSVLTFQQSIEEFLVLVDDLRLKANYAQNVCAGKSINM